MIERRNSPRRKRLLRTRARRVADWAVVAPPTSFFVTSLAVEPLPRVVGLDELRSDPELVAMQVCQKGSRLSVQAVSSAEWGRVRALAKRKLKL